MPSLSPTISALALILLAMILAMLVIWWPGLLKPRGGKALAFIALFVLPLAGFSSGLQVHVKHSKTTQFCLSCHEMEPYGRSLHADDSEFVPAQHFQNNRVPRKQACFTCHTDYTMFGDIRAKLRGLRHVYVHYMKGPPEEIELYNPYQNRECLNCHAGARSFEEDRAHSRDDITLERLSSNQVSCLESGCHEITHGLEYLEDLDFWEPATEVTHD